MGMLCLDTNIMPCLCEQKGLTGLVLACEGGNLATVRWLYANNPACLHEIDEVQNPMLRVCVCVCAFGILSYCNVLPNCTQSGNTALHVASENANLEVMAWLVEAGVDPNIGNKQVCPLLLY